MKTVRMPTEEEIQRVYAEQTALCIFDQVRFSRRGNNEWQGNDVSFVRALVDSGATGTVLDKHHLRRLRIPPRDIRRLPKGLDKMVAMPFDPPTHGVRLSVSVMNGISVDLYVAICDLSSFHKVFTAGPDKQDVDAILGMDYLRAARAVLDVGNGAVYYGGMDGMARVAAMRMGTAERKR